ncbi:MAG: replication-relaxation family protein [Peptostreptococcaceae bacterium]
MYDVINELEECDFNFLFGLYNHRCLTFFQAYNHFYKDNSNSYNDCLDKYINKLIRLKLVEDTLFANDNLALFLTKNGVDFLREYFNLDKEIYVNGRIKKSIYTAGDLKMLPRLIPHQVFLNQFVLDFKTICSFAKEDNWAYFDEKFVSKYTFIRPDGLIEFKDTDYFLELDMNTESKKQLIDKWDKYSNFLRRKKPKRKIVVLFIVENTKNMKNRIDVVNYTINEAISHLISDNFDIVVGSKEDLLKYMFTKKSKTLYEVLKNEGFKVSSATKNKDLFNNANYSYYIRKLDCNNKIINENGYSAEYLIDEFDESSSSSLMKAKFYYRNLSHFKGSFKRHIFYVIVVDDLDAFFKKYRHCKFLFRNEFIYFTTLNKLSQNTLSKSLFRYDKSGSIMYLNKMKNKITYI